MLVDDVVFAAGAGAFFYDDQAAIRAGAPADGFIYRGAPVTPGFEQIRMPAQALSIGLVLSDGAVAWGDMMSVQYSGAAGRDPLFRSADAERYARAILLPRLANLELRSFRDACSRVLADDGAGSPMPLAVKYGCSQALLRAVAHMRRTTMAEVLCEELQLAVIAAPTPLYAQSGDAREINVDKMILRNAAILPQGLINSKAKFGPGGAKFREYAHWVVSRIRSIGDPQYRPTLHFDVYGWIGYELGMDAPAMADFIARLAEELSPFDLNIECPADFGSRDAQIEGYAALTAELRRKGSPARIVVDEHCNTLQDVRDFASASAADVIQIKMPDVGSVEDSALAVLACREHGVRAYLGGSCAETDLSARASVHVAVATRADMMLAKPGMGVDEALCIVGNEQSRLLALLQRRRAPPA